MRLRKLSLRQKKWNAKRLLINTGTEQIRSVKMFAWNNNQSKKNNKDNVGMPCILGKDKERKVNLEDKMEVWKEYEDKLLNEEND